MIRQGLSHAVSESELIHIAVKSMGLDELGPFDPQKKIIEYLLQDHGMASLAAMTLTGFSEELASDSPAPGGGSAAAYAGVLAASLGTMVANLSAHKKGWEEKHSFFVDWAVKGQNGRVNLLRLVDEDTHAFNSMMEAFRMPKENEADKKSRTLAIQRATRRAIESPLNIMREAYAQFELLDSMAREGNPNSVSDAGVGASCALAAVEGGYLNVLINLSGIKKKEKADAYKAEAEELLSKAREVKDRVFASVLKTIETAPS